MIPARVRALPGTRRGVAAVAAGLAGVVLAVAAIAAVLPGGGTHEVSARFRSAPGLYVGNRVAVLGVPVGRIDGISVHDAYVTVRMRLPASVRLPADAKAVLMAPAVVSDRYVEFTPAYSGAGPALPDGAVLDVDRTVTPLGIDQITGALDALARALGPTGANSDGSLSALLSTVATDLGGNGALLHDTITGLAAAIPALAGDPGQLSTVLTSLDTLTRALADHDRTVTSFYGDLAGASRQLAGEGPELTAALDAVQAAVTQVGAFLTTNSAAVGSTVANLAALSRALLSDQNSLRETLDVAPTAFQNLGQTVIDTPTGPRVSARVLNATNVGGLVQQYCGPGLEALVRITAGQASPLDALCLSVSGLAHTPPGAPAGPDLGLDRFLGAR